MDDVLSGYRSPTQRELALDQLAAAAGAELRVLGTTVEGRPIRAARVPCHQRTGRSLLVCAGIHGPALTPWVLQRVAELTDGRSIRANTALIINDARFAGRLAAAL